jgi:hypothetical protein
MSLVSMASPWTNDDIPKKKRLSTLRANPKSVVPNMSAPEEYNTIEMNELESSKTNIQNMQPATFDDLQQATTQRNRRVDDLLNKITSIDANQESHKMGQFKPPENPMVQVRTDMEAKPPHSDADTDLPSYINANQKMRNVAIHNFSADNSRAATFSSYNQSYETPQVLAPYYSQQAHSRGMHKPMYNDSKLMERINYMIHMLEAQQSEKTSNITEEFILYTFLGVFIIYVVDSFARAGKYTR